MSENLVTYTSSYTCNGHLSGRVSFFLCTHRVGLLPDGICRPELDVAVDEIVSYPVAPRVFSRLVPHPNHLSSSSSTTTTTTTTTMTKGPDHIRVDDGAKDLTAAGVVEEDLLLVQGREAASDLLDIHDGQWRSRLLLKCSWMKIMLS